MTDALFRKVLWTTAVFNIAGAASFLFPDSLGRLLGLPVPVPALYSWFIAFMVLSFGAAYAWLALQPQIDRPLVALTGIGKTGFFAIMVLCWLRGEVPGHGVLVASGDLVFAVLFFFWLLRHTPDR